MTNAVAAALCANDLVKRAASIKAEVTTSCSLMRAKLDATRDPAARAAIEEACNLLTVLKILSGTMITEAATLKTYVGAANMCGEIDRLERAGHEHAAHQTPENLTLQA